MLVGGVLLGLIGVAAGRLIFPEASGPALVAGLHGDWDARNRDLAQRVATRFPPGSPEAALTAALRDDGFTIGTGEANWQRAGVPCKTFVRIGWQAAGGRVAGTEASMFEACL
jgi:hypothetical protein